MKKLSFWRRLTSSLATLLLLLFIGGGLAWWVEQARTNSKHLSDEMELDAARIRVRVTQVREALADLRIDPADAGKQKKVTDSKDELNRYILNVQSHYTDPNLVRAMNSAQFRPGAATLPDSTALTQLIDTFRLQSVGFLDDLDSQVDRVESDTDKAYRSKLTIGSIGLVLLLLATIGVAFAHSAAVARPLGQLNAALGRMSQGDFTRRVEIQGGDEFAILGEGLNRLAGDLSGLVGQVQRSGIQVNTTATQIAATAREQQTTANEIAATTAEIGATSKEISATSKELVRTMNEVSGVAEETAQVAGSGQTAITSMETTMRQIMEASGSITAKLAVLSEKTSNINSVVTTITKVADQTNLLSLNAAIEAEKAGEYGLGFAVVAMEIRRLADQTAVATYDIEKMVKEMQSAVSAGVMGMDKFSEEVRRGVGEIRQVSAQLAQIIYQVQALTPRFQTVNEGMSSQATGAQQISETLTQLSEAAHQTAESLRQSNQAIEQLNSAARGLQTCVSRFRLEGA